MIKRRKIRSGSPALFSTHTYSPMYNFTAFSIRNLPGNEKLRQSAMAQEVEADDDSVLKHFMIQKNAHVANDDIGKAEMIKFKH